MSAPETPFADAVDAFLREAPTAFSTPGHKRNPALIGEDALLANDTPWHGGADDLRGGGQIRARAEALAGIAFGADVCRFSGNGSTHPNQALCLAVAGEGEPVIASRCSHKSVAAGLVLSGARPVWVAPAVDEARGVALGHPVEAIEAALAAEPDARAILLVEPSWLGVVSHVARIAEIAHARGIPLICDQAWAGHFGFHPGVPASALALGADAVAISTHKALTSFTPGAVLLARDSGFLDLGRLDAAFDVLETTSPSASLFGSIDRSRALLEQRGRELLGDALGLAELARRLIGAIDGVQLLDDGVLAHASVGARDPLKLIVDVSATLADGIAVDRTLNELGIRLEGADRRTLVPLLTIGDDEARVRRLASALTTAIDEHRGELREAPRVATSWRTLHEQAMTPRQAFFAPRERVPFAAAIGRISAELVAPYPPGIPALAPGEVVSAELVAALQGEAAAGTRMAGVSDTTLTSLYVVA
ncbi:MAG: arginine decarboxylase [Gaiellales bacterium]|nr:arginine decarboxylase [Gaiellales bacterium]